MNSMYRFSKHDQIGEVRIPLNTIDLAQTIEEWRNLTKVETNGGQVSDKVLVLVCFTIQLIIFYLILREYYISLLVKLLRF